MQKENLIQQLIYENSLQKVRDILMKCMVQYDCCFVEVYRYSHFDNLVEGLLEIDSQMEIKRSKYLRETLLSMPLLYSTLHQCEVVYIENEVLRTGIPSKYFLPDEVKTVVVLPIAKNNVAIGFLCIHFEFIISEAIKKSLIVFSEWISKTLFVGLEKKNVIDTKFSKREIETMTLISEGWNTLQIAQYLSISEATVKHYIKTFMKKSNTFNRSHAVGYLLKNIIR